MSSILAFTMLISSLVMVNVVNVSAATTTDTWTAAADSSKSWLDISSGGFQSGTCSCSGRAITFKDNIFNGNSSNNPNGQTGYYNSDAKNTFTVTPGKANSTLKIWCFRNNNGEQDWTITHIKEDSSATIMPDSTGSKKIRDRGHANTEAMEISLSGDDTYTFKAGGSNVYIFRIDLITDDGQGGDDSGFTWEFDDTALTQLVSDLPDFQKDKLEFGVGEVVNGTSKKTLTERNLLVYKGTNYIIKPRKELLQGEPADGVVVTKEGNTFKVKPTKDMFVAAVVVDNAKINVTGGANRILHLKCTDEMVFSILLDNEGKAKTMLVSTNEKGGYDLSKLEDIVQGTIDLHEDTYTVSMSGGKLDKTEYAITSGGENSYSATFTPDPIKSFTEGVESVDLTKGIVNASDLKGERLYGGTRLGEGYFRVISKDSYQNVYSVSGSVEDGYGEDAMAIVLRAASKDGGDQDAQAEILKGGIGFTVGELGEGNTGKLTLKVQSVKDDSSTGTGATLGLAKTTGSDASEEIGEDVESKPVTATVDEGVKEDIVFDKLQSNQTYGVYNKGKVGENGNIRIIEAKFEVVSASKQPVQIEPTDEGYVFTGDGMLITESEKALVEGYNGAYASLNTDINNVTISEGKAQLVDSTPDNGISTKMTMPMTNNIKAVNSGALKISGTIGNITNGGGKWNILDFGNNVSIRTTSTKAKNKDEYTSDNKKGISDPTNGMISLALKETVSGETKYTYAEAGVKYEDYGNKEVKYVITFDFDNKEVTLQLDEQDPVTISAPALGQIKQITANTANNPAREFYLGNIKIEKTTIVKSGATVKFDVADTSMISGSNDAADSKGNITITRLKDKSTVTIKAMGDSNAKTFTGVEPGEQFTISGKDATNIWKWVTRNKGELDTELAHKSDIKFFNGKKGEDSERYLVYTVPEGAETGQEYGVQFTGTKDISKLDLESPTIKGEHTTPLKFGQYGFGNDKVRVCGGNDARDNVTYTFEVAALSDYDAAGYCSDTFNDVMKDADFNEATNAVPDFNQYGILNNSTTRATSIIFKVDESVVNNAGGDITANVDRTATGKSSNEIVVNESEDGISAWQKVDVTQAANKRAAFKIKAGYTYKITNEKADKIYIKSIRILNPNNIFDAPNDKLTDVQAKADLGKYSAFTEAHPGVELEAVNDSGAPSSDDTVFRVIGAISLSGADLTNKETAEYALSQITAVGYDVYDKTAYDKASQSSKIGNKFNESLREMANEDAPTKLYTITFAGNEDGIVNTAVDYEHTSKEEGSPSIGQLNPASGSDFASVYVQTFVATDTPIVLVPWVSYEEDFSTAANKIYTQVSKSAGEGTEDDNNIYLTPAAE